MKYIFFFMWSIIGQVAALITYATLGIDFRRRLRGEIFDVQSFVGCFFVVVGFGWLRVARKKRKKEMEIEKERERGCESLRQKLRSVVQYIKIRPSQTCKIGLERPSRKQIVRTLFGRAIIHSGICAGSSDGG